MVRLDQFQQSHTSPMRQHILEMARKQNLKVGDCLDIRMVLHKSFHISTNPSESLYPELKTLISDGIFDQDARDNMKLTEKGFNLLYR